MNKIINIMFVYVKYYPYICIVGGDNRNGSVIKLYHQEGGLRPALYNNKGA